LHFTQKSGRFCQEEAAIEINPLVKLASKNENKKRLSGKGKGFGRLNAGENHNPAQRVAQQTTPKEHLQSNGIPEQQRRRKEGWFSGN